MYMSICVSRFYTLQGLITGEQLPFAIGIINLTRIVMHIPPYFHQVSLRSAAVISVLANGLLLILLNQRTSRSLGNYRFLIGIFAVLDILISLFHAWYIPMFILGEYGFMWFGFGTIHKKLKLDANITYVALFYAPFCLLCLHFIYRYMALVRPEFVQKYFKYFGLACAIYITVCTAACTWLADFGQVRCILTFYLFLIRRSRGIPFRFRNVLAPYGIPNWSEDLNVDVIRIVENDNQLDVPVILEIITEFSIVSHTLLISLFCIVKIAAAFNHLIDIRARRMHIHLFRALLIQFSIPVLTSLFPLGAIFQLPATGVDLGQLGSVLGLLASVYPVLDPILIIVSISSFRLTLQRWFTAVFGNIAEQNERNALEKSRILTAAKYSIAMNMV